jgi:hypothetical protein
MEKIMSKTNDTSRPATFEDHHTLADSELDAVSGGTWSDIFDSVSTAAQAVSSNCPVCERAVAAAVNGLFGKNW